MPQTISFQAAAKTTQRRGQPMPIGWWTERLETMMLTATAITRVWAPPDARKCRLCPGGCGAVQAGGVSVCTVIATGEVSDEEAPLYARRPLFS